jgi:hypothetical protein
MTRLAKIAWIAATMCVAAPAQALDQHGAERPASIYNTFIPGREPIRHRIDYEIWDYALKNMVISMGPSLRKTAGGSPAIMGTRRRFGHNSIYRLEGSMVAFGFLTPEAIASFTEYRKDLERVSDTLDLQTLPRNEQLAYWINLHNVAMVELMAKEWPVRQPRQIDFGGIGMHDVRFITVEGVKLSLRDIREHIVYPNWKDPKVIYGFWRGEIGGPELQREAYTGANVASLLNIAADGFINSLRGTQKRGSQLHVSTLYEEVAPFYFPNFEEDLRAHFAQYANEDVAEILAKTSGARPTIREPDIADLSGGARQNTFFGSGSRLAPALIAYLRQRDAKLRYMDRREIPRGTVIFSNIDLPGDPPNKNEVE